MTKKFLIALSLVMIISCGTIPDPSEENIGRLIIYREFKNKDNLSMFGSIGLVIEHIDSGKKTEYTMKPANDIKSIFLKPGKYKVIELTFTYNNTGNEGKPIKQDISFEIERGNCTVLSKKMYISIYSKNGTNSIRKQMRSLTNINPKEIQQLLNNEENGHLWTY